MAMNTFPDQLKCAEQTKKAGNLNNQKLEKIQEIALADYNSSYPERLEMLAPPLPRYSDFFDSGNCI